LFTAAIKADKATVYLHNLCR